MANDGSNAEMRCIYAQCFNSQLSGGPGPDEDNTDRQTQTDGQTERMVVPLSVLLDMCMNDVYILMVHAKTWRVFLDKCYQVVSPQTFPLCFRSRCSTTQQ